MRKVRYIRLGTALSVAGAAILTVSLLLLGSYPGISTGIAVLVLGLVILLLGTTAPGVSAELADLLVRVGYENLGRLLEEIGLNSRAVYLPSTFFPGEARAFIPLDAERHEVAVSGKLDDRLVTFWGAGDDDVGLAVSTPGTAALSLLQYPPGGTMDEISVTLTQLAVATLRVAKGVEVHERAGRIEVLVRRESVPSRWLSSRVEWCLGSLAASVAAAVVAEAKQRPVYVENEEVKGSQRVVVLALQPE